MIYEICFVRSLTIAPLRNFIRRRLYRREIVDDRRWKKYSAYQYQWDSYPAFAKAAGAYDLPSRNGSMQGLRIYWSSIPTATQQEIIDLNDGRMNALSKTKSYLKQTSDIEHMVGTLNGILRISNSQRHYVSGLFGIKLMRTCTQIREETAEFVYGRNKFSFDTVDRHSDDVFDNEPENIPGFPHPGGDPQTVEQLSRCLEQLFDRQVHHNRFIWYDHFLHFLTRIGPFNASKLKNVKFRGVFKTLNEDGYPRGSSVCFLNLLPIYTVVLDKVCTDLRKVTLELGEESTSLIPPHSGRT